MNLFSAQLKPHLEGAGTTIEEEPTTTDAIYLGPTRLKGWRRGREFDLDAEESGAW